MPRLWPRSLFGRNLLVLLALAGAAQLSTIFVYILLQRPRVVEVAELVATQVNTLDAALSQIPADHRDAYIALVDRVGGRFTVQKTPPPFSEAKSHGLLADLFIRIVQAHLDKNIEVRWMDGSKPRVWVHVNISGERYWISLPIHATLRYRWLTSAMVLSLCMALSATLAAMLIQRRINQPLRDIANAASNLGAGGRPERLPNYSTTELAAVAEQFNTMLDSLEEMEASRTVMLAGISHDIRTPLTKLRLALAMDSHASELPLSQYIDQIDVIVGQFLDFGRTGSDEPLACGDINEQIRELADGFADRGHPFALSLQSLPALYFRPVAMMRVINNLMENAVKYGVAGLEVQTRVENNHAVISVLDRGPGLPAGEETHLLKPFVRADVGRSHVSGSGLGLAIVDRIVRLHGGRLDLHRRLGGGLEARVTLPSAPPSPMLAG